MRILIKVDRTVLVKSIWLFKKVSVTNFKRIIHNQKINSLFLFDKNFKGYGQKTIKKSKKWILKTKLVPFSKQTD